MANRKKLSWKSRERIEQEINIVGGDEALSKKATKLVLNKLKSSIEQNELSNTYTKNIIITIKKKNCTIKIDSEENNEDFVKIIKEKSYKTLEKLIDNQCIIAKGISAATCKRFRLGETIDGEAFDILCTALEVIPEEVCEKKQPFREILKQAEELNLALCQFNYYSQRMFFRERQVAYSSLYLSKLTANKYSCHWLLKSLMINQSPRCNHLIIPLNILKISSNLKNGLGHQLLLQIRENLKNRQSSQSKFKITKNSTMNNVAEVLQQILQKQNIIFLVQSLDDIGVKNGQAIIQQFWNPITANLKTTDHHLFLCFVSVNKPDEHQSIGYDHLFEVGGCFEKEDLNNWLKKPDYNKLYKYKPIKTTHDIEPEVNRIWEQCQGDNDRLLEEIYSSCDCKIEETLWHKI